MRNQKGSVMTVAIIVIAILSFSLTSLSAYTFRTASNTNRVVEGNYSDNRAKRAVSQAINDLEREMNALIEEHGVAAFNDFEDNYYDVDIIEAIEADSGTTIEETETFKEDDIVVRTYRVSYTVDDTKDMVRYLYLTNHGIEYEEYDAFSFSIGTNEDVVVNGGQYLDATELYGRRIFAGFNTVYRDFDGFYHPTEGTLGGTYNFPSGDDAQFVTREYRECSPEGNCLNVDGEENNVILDRDQYFSEEQDRDKFFTDIFSGFNLMDYYYQTLNAEVDASQRITADNYYSLLTSDANDGVLGELEGDLTVNETHTLSEDTIKDGDLTIDIEGNNLELNGHSLVVLGDLHIDSLAEINGPGQIFIYGDATFENDRDMKVTANLYATGDIHVQFDSETGFEIVAQGQANEGFGLFANGHVLIDYSRTFAHQSGVRMSLFVFARQSVLINASLDRMAFGGAIYAQGQGDPLPNFYIDEDDEEVPFRGIWINSYNGTIDLEDGSSDPGDGGDNGGGGGGPPGNPGANPGGGRPPGAGPPGQGGGDHTFSFNSLYQSTPGQSPSDNLRESFDNLPEFSKLVLYPEPDKLSSEKSTFMYETRE